MVVYNCGNNKARMSLIISHINMHFLSQYLVLMVYNMVINEVRMTLIISHINMHFLSQYIGV